MEYVLDQLAEALEDTVQQAIVKQDADSQLLVVILWSSLPFTANQQYILNGIMQGARPCISGRHEPGFWVWDGSSSSARCMHWTGYARDGIGVFAKSRFPKYRYPWS